MDGTPMRIFFILMEDAGLSEKEADCLLTNLLVESDAKFLKEEEIQKLGAPSRSFFILMSGAGISDDAADFLLTNLLTEFDEIASLDAAESEARGRLWELWPEYVR